MADVFLSYSRRDKELAARLVALLEGQGWDVFWDQETRAGTLWPKVLEDELGRARCLVVLWTSSSIGSRWVRIEADEALQNDKLLPVRIENVKPPMEFRQTQTLDLIGWNGEPDDPRLPRLYDDLRAIAGTVPRGVPVEKAHEAAAGRVEVDAPRTAEPPAAPATWQAPAQAVAESLFDSDSVAVVESPPATMAPAPPRAAPADAASGAADLEEVRRLIAEPALTAPPADARPREIHPTRPAGLAGTPLGLRVAMGSAAIVAVVASVAVWWDRAGTSPLAERPVAAPTPAIVSAPPEKAAASAAGSTAVPLAPAAAETTPTGPATTIAASPPPRVTARSSRTTSLRCIEIAEKFQTTGQLSDEERRFLSGKECAK